MPRPKEPRGSMRPSRPADVPAGHAGLRNDPATRPEQRVASAPPPASWVIERQRTLRAHGYQVVVDGVWGPISQRAWSLFQRGVRPGSVVSNQLVNREARRRARVEAQRVDIEMQRRLARQAQEFAQKRALEARAARIREAREPGGGVHRRALTVARADARKMTPSVIHDIEQHLRVEEPKRDTAIAVRQERNRVEAAVKKARATPVDKLSVDQLALLVADPLADDSDPIGVRKTSLIRRWLAARGYDLPAGTDYSPEVHRAILTEFRNAQIARHKQQVADITRQLYSTRVLRESDPLPVIGGIADPARVLSILQGGGFAASVLWAEIGRRLRRSPGAFIQYRNEEIRKLVQGLDPTGLSGRQSTFGVFATLGLPGTVPAPALRAYEAAAAIGTDEAIEEVTVLLNARNGPDLERRVRALEQKRERAFLIRQKEQAEHGGKAWWQYPIDALNYGGDKLRAGVLEGYSGVEQLANVAVDVMPFRQDQESAAPVPQHVVDPRVRAQQIDDWWKREHPWMHLAWEITVDPTWFAPPVRFAGGTRALARFGYGLEESGRGIVLVKAGTALRTPEMIRQSVRGTVDLWKMIGTQGAPGWETQALSRAVRFAQSQRRALDESIGAARARVYQAAAHGFSVVKDGNVGRDDIETFVSAQTANAIADLDDRYQRQLHTVIGGWLDTLRGSRASLYANAAYGEKSSVGQSLLARAAEEYRTQEVQRRAFAEYRAAYQRSLAERGLDVLPDVVDDVAQAAGADAYRAYFKQASTYITGGGAYEVREELHRAVKRRLDHFEQVTMRNIQRRLERDAADGGYSLFHEETGVWLGARDDAAEQLRAMQRYAYDYHNRFTHENPNYDRPFITDDYLMLKETEIGTRVGRAIGWANRERAIGRDIPESWVEDEIAAITKDVESAWVKRKDGWYDTRARLDSPRIYGRAFSDLYDRAALGAHPFLRAEDFGELGEMLEAGRAAAGERLGALAADPAIAQGDVLDTELRALAWWTGGRRTRYDFGGEFELGDVLPHEAGLFDNALRRFILDPKYREQIDEFIGTFDELGEAMGRAWDEAIPKALLREGALWQAAAHAQSLPLKIAYNVARAGLDTWLFLTLPLRPAWLVRNVADNGVKVLIEGARDPRAYLHGAKRPGEMIHSIFDLGITPLRAAIRLNDRVAGTNVLGGFDAALEAFWAHPPEVIQKILGAHGIDVPERVLQNSVFRPAHDQRILRPLGGEMEEASLYSRFKDRVWDITATHPESYFKRVLYRTEYQRALDEGLTDVQAFERAWAKVEDTLFDYGKVTTIEDNLRVIAPFIQFWRKNTGFWLRTMRDKPYLPLALERFEDGLKEDVNADLPEWMRRYIHTDQLADGIAHVPGLQWLASHLSDVNVMYDPVNFFSFAPLYRTFKQENPLLPEDKAGWKFIAPIVDVMNDWGLSMNPLIRKPLEVAGVLNLRAWQSVFPQTTLVQAFTRRYFSELFPNGLNIENIVTDKLFELMGQDAIAGPASDRLFNEYVQMEVANQVARGEPANRAAAEQKIRQFFWLQSLWAYFVGAYVRRMTPQDFHLYTIGEALHDGEVDFTDLSERDQEAYQVWRRRKMAATDFDRYTATAPLIQAYYQQGSYQAKERFKLDHPEVIPYVEPVWRGHVLSSGYVQQAAKIADTISWSRLSALADDLDLDRDTEQIARTFLVTPDLEAFWQKNDTHADWQKKHLRGLYHREMYRLNQLFFAFPQDDYDAKDGFLKEHPELVHWWRRNDLDSDDFRRIDDSAKAALRERYFEYVDKRDWNGADTWLRRFPFIFEGTKAEGKVNADGTWNTHGGGGAAYLKAKPWLDYLFDVLVKQQGWDAANAWLFGSSAGARIARDYLRSRGKLWGRNRTPRTQHARDYLAAKQHLDFFFKLLKGSPELANAWLAGDSKEAAIVRAYFDKYGKKGNGEHARDYLAARDELQHYFDLLKRDKAAAKRWLNSGAPDALKVLAYFKKWGKVNRLARKWSGFIHSENPELFKRLQFWQRYFTLAPSDRPEFVNAHAEEYGVFVWGDRGEQELRERERAFLREAYGRGLSQRAALFLRVKPLLDLFYSLDDRFEKSILIKGNPELAEYLDKYAGQPITGDKKTDALLERYYRADPGDRKALVAAHPGLAELIERETNQDAKVPDALRSILDRYFSLPRGSDERSRLLREHPEVQDYFDAHSTPAERAIRATLEVYFSIPVGPERKRYAAQHPEISAYFDRRRMQRGFERAQLAAFDEADPRLDALYERAHVIEVNATRMREALWWKSHRDEVPETVEVRRDVRRIL